MARKLRTERFGPGDHEEKPGKGRIVGSGTARMPFPGKEGLPGRPLLLLGPASGLQTDHEQLVIHPIHQ